MFIEIVNLGLYCLLSTRFRNFSLISASMASEIKLETAKFDARFPNTNQTKNCWTNFRDYHRCVKARGDDYQPCQWFKKAYTSLCPVAWVEQWDEQVENGTFAGKI